MMKPSLQPIFLTMEDNLLKLLKNKLVYQIKSIKQTLQRKMEIK
jgi:hypothetical protein